MTARVALSSGDYIYVDAPRDEVAALLNTGAPMVQLGSRIVYPPAVAMVDELPAPSTVTVERLEAASDEIIPGGEA